MQIMLHENTILVCNDNGFTEEEISSFKSRLTEGFDPDKIIIVEIKDTTLNSIIQEKIQPLLLMEKITESRNINNMKTLELSEQAILMFLVDEIAMLRFTICTANWVINETREKFHKDFLMWFEVQYNILALMDSKELTTNWHNMRKEAIAWGNKFNELYNEDKQT